VILAVDSGTTSTRVWALDGGRVTARASGRAGARDVARTGDREALLDRVRTLAGEALAEAGGGWESVRAVVAFGMITSELGLEELPHLEAPVDTATLATAMRERRYPGITAPVFLVPGVRSGGDGELETVDLMRGEETEVAGLLALRQPEPPLIFVSTGSHTKFVAIDDTGWIQWTLTTLSGELVWALHKETILADLIDPEGGIGDPEALRLGAHAVAVGGLSRALFATRLLSRLHDRTDAECSDFVHGAVAASDLASLRWMLQRRGWRRSRAAIAGTGALAEAYRTLLEDEDWATELHVVDQPVGALGAWSLYRSRSQSDIPAPSPTGGAA
jgi:2-dehydro-3-deoxygalactonokinase